MTADAWLRLALVPAAVWIASLAARHWGHAASGYLGGLPLIPAALAGVYCARLAVRARR